MMEVTGLDYREGLALVLLLKIGMDTYTGADRGTADALEGLRGIPDGVIDRMIAKVSLAAEKTAREDA